MFEELLVLNDIGQLILRIVVGGVFIYHALPKLKNSAEMAKMVGMPPGAIAMLGVVEAVSGAAFIVGLFTQIAAILLSIVMVGAIYFKIRKWKVPFTARNKTGWEFDLILLAATISILTTGGGSIGLF